MPRPPNYPKPPLCPWILAWDLVLSVFQGDLTLYCSIDSLGPCHSLDWLSAESLHSFRLPRSPLAFPPKFIHTSHHYANLDPSWLPYPQVFAHTRLLRVLRPPTTIRLYSRQSQRLGAPARLNTRTIFSLPQLYSSCSDHPAYLRCSPSPSSHPEVSCPP